MKYLPRAAAWLALAALAIPGFISAQRLDPAKSIELAKSLQKQRKYQEANNLFRQLVADWPDNADIRVAWGDLYREHWQPDVARDLYAEALKIKPNHARALLGMAELEASDFAGDAAKTAAEALKSDPHLVEAQELIARTALEDNNDTRARDEAHKALDMNPNSVQARAVLATMDWLADKKESSYDPHDARGYETAGHFFTLNRRYTEAIEFYRKALALDPELYSARSQMAIQLMRVGQDEEAKKELQNCWDHDFQDTQTKNSLMLLDTFKDYVTFRTDNTILRVNKKEAELLHPYFEAEMKKVIATYEDKYKYKLQYPVQLEVYPNHDDFAVRTMGLPGIGALGVTFNYSIAMDSPSGRPPGEFHWAYTLWHEMSHVFTLSMTNSKIPRWFTEGIAVHEESATNPEWGDRIGAPELNAIKEHTLLPIADLDRGFIHPTYPQQIIVSYFQGGQVVDFITQKWGWNTVLAMVHDYAQVTDTPTVIRKELGVSPEEFDKQFAGFIDSRYGQIVSHLSQWKDGMKTMVEAAQKKDDDAVIKEGLAIRDLYKDYVEQGSVYEFLATAYEDKRDTADAIDELERYAHIGGRNPAVLKRLAKDLVAANRKKEAAEVLDRLNYIYPNDAEMHHQLAQLWLEQGNSTGAAREFGAELAYKPIDPAGAHFGLAEAWNAQRQTQKAKDELFMALEIAPDYRPAQKLLLELNAAGKQDPKD